MATEEKVVAAPKKAAPKKVKAAKVEETAPKAVVAKEAKVAKAPKAKAAKAKKAAVAPKAPVAKKAKAKKGEAAPKAAKALKKSSIKDFDTIIRPIITEKTMSLIQEQNKVTVEVDPKANRAAIKIAFEAVFGVKVSNVHIANVRAKSTRRGGKYEGSVPGFKKAIVTLAEGQALDLFKE